MNYAQYLEKGKTIESTESLIEKVINSQGQDENALQELVNRAQSQDSKAIEFLQMLQQQSGVSKFEEPSGPIVKKDQQDPNMPVAAETGTVDGRKYTYMPYQGEGQGPIDRFEYIGQDGNTYGMTIQGPDTTYVMNGQQYNDPEGQRVIKERRAAVVREKCGGSVKKKETGDKITRKKVMAKGGCPCMIKKVGGRLIEVDSCTGLPVHRNGGNIVEVDHEGVPVHKVGGQVKKFKLGQLIENVLDFGRPERQTIISPKNWVSTTNAPYSYPLFRDDGFDKEAWHPEAEGLFFIPDRGLVWGSDPYLSGRPTKYPKKENFMAYPHDQENVGLRGQISPDLIPGDTYLEYPTLRVGSRLSDAQTVLNEQSKKIKETMFQPLAPKTDELNPDRLKAEADKKKAAAHNAKVKTFYSKMSDSDKRALQDMLKVTGYYKGEIDGLIGNGTLGALRKFQQDNKLTVDGMAGRLTFDALRAKTRQVAQPVTDPTAVPGYTQAMQLLNQTNGSVSTAPVKTGGPTGGMGLNDVRQGRDVQLVGPKVGLNLTAGLEIPQRKQGGQLNYANYLN